MNKPVQSDQNPHQAAKWMFLLCLVLSLSKMPFCMELEVMGLCKCEVLSSDSEYPNSNHVSVVHACNPSGQEERDRRILGVYWSASLANQ